MKPLYIFDIDGTIANIEHRLHFITDKANQDWDTFNRHTKHDLPIRSTINLCQCLINADKDVWFFTGRMDKNNCRDDTLWWLAAYVHHNIEPHHLVMRELNDTRNDDIIKQEMLDRMLIEDRERLLMTFDDRQRVVDMWRRNDIICAQVAPGNF